MTTMSVSAAVPAAVKAALLSELLVARVATRDAKTLPWINEARR